MNLTRTFRPVDLVAWPAAILVLAFAPVRPAGAGPADDRAVLQAECGGCHVAYPAKLLPRAAWRQVLSQLDRHYGVDASLDDASLAAVARQLSAQPGAPAAQTGTLPRITGSKWFREEHDEVGAGNWRGPTVKSAANCDACHPGAARGVFDDDQLSIPR